MSKPTTPRTEPPPPIGPRPGNPAPILPKPNGKPSKASLLHRDRPIRLDHTRLPLGLGALMQRRSVLTGHAEHFWRWADGDGVWLAVPPAALGRLPYCTSREAVEQLLGGANTTTSASAAPARDGGWPARGGGAADPRSGVAGVGRNHTAVGHDQPGGWAPCQRAFSVTRGAQLAPGEPSSPRLPGCGSPHR